MKSTAPSPPPLPFQPSNPLNHTLIGLVMRLLANYFFTLSTLCYYCRQGVLTFCCRVHLYLRVRTTLIVTSCLFWFTVLEPLELDSGLAGNKMYYILLPCHHQISYVFCRPKQWNWHEVLHYIITGIPFHNFIILLGDFTMVTESAGEGCLSSLLQKVNPLDCVLVFIDKG